jgi:drug/metabolite transporter (DMT)-like permease
MGRSVAPESGLGVAFVVTGAALFGTLGIFGEVARAVGLSTATLLGGRFLLATLVLWGYLLTRDDRPRLGRRTVAAELGLGLVYAAMALAYFESLAWLSAGIAALVFFTYPVQVTVVSAIALDEAVTVPKALALLSALGGVALVAITGRGAVEMGLAGLALIVAASLLYTVYLTGTRVAVATVSTPVHVAHVFLGATVALLWYGAWTGTLSIPTTRTDLLLTAGITVLGTLLPMILVTAGLARIPASTASIVSTSEPLTTVILGVVLLGESLTVPVAVGGLLILASVVIATPAVERALRRRLGRERDRPADGSSDCRRSNGRLDSRVEDD